LLSVQQNSGLNSPTDGDAMVKLKGLKCRECGRHYPATPVHVCEFCFGPLEVDYRYDALKGVVTRESIAAGPPSMWRYKDLLPIEGDVAVGHHVGFTPLIRAQNLADELGCKEVWIKNDSVCHPTWSFKDRVVAVAVTKALEFGFDTVACASTGNLANSVAAHGAALGLDSYVLIPADLEEQKILASGIYGTTLVAVDGSYDDVNRLCTELCAERDWAFVNVNLRPYYADGSKTLAFEIAEQLGWELPDRCVVPVASGSLFTKLAKGFEEWLTLGLLDGQLPRMNGAQAEGCAPVASAFAAGHETCRPVRPNTIAKSLAIGNPADGPYALDLARRSNGSVEAVSEQEIREGIALLAETTGIFTETAGGVTAAVLRKLATRGEIGPGERVVLVITGDGLKTLDAVRGTFATYTIAPTLEAFLDEVPQPVGV
jgi:threonine synthase